MIAIEKTILPILIRPTCLDRLGFLNRQMDQMLLSAQAHHQEYKSFHGFSAQ